MNLLDVRNLDVEFPLPQPFWQKKRRVLKAVNDVSFSLPAGETLGLVGESGCGKSTLGRAIMRLLQPTRGEIRFEGRDLAPLPESRLRPLRRKFQMVFQDPYGSLNPRLTIAETLAEPLEIHRLATGPGDKERRLAGLMNAVGLDPALLSRYPHEFSGGQRQRIGIARALAVEPALIICDEPVSALDVSVQAQIINLLQDLQARRHLSYLFISHDLAVVEHISKRILVMYLGWIMEAAEAKSLCRSPQHPYTRALLSAVPAIDPETQAKRILLPGELPSPVDPPAGCPFHTRCPLAEARCRATRPALRQTAADHWTRCHLV